MLRLLENEAELAAIIGHEMAHVDKKHCIERLQYELRAREIGGQAFAAIVALGTYLFTQGVSSELEAEADRQGILYAARAGYHPQVAQLVFARMRDLYEQQQKAPDSIPAEVGGMLKGAIDDYFGSHPPAAERIAALEQAMREHVIRPETAPYYLGERNFRERTALALIDFQTEWVRRRIHPPERE